MKNKWIRVLVCFVLVCSILVNISPIRAEAFVFDPFTIGYVTKEVAFWAISLGLGVSLGVEAIEQGARFVDEFSSWSVGRLNDETVALMQNDMIQLMATGNPDMPWMVDSRLVDGVREWMFESGTVTVGEAVTDGCAYYNGNQLAVLPDDALSYTFHYIASRTDGYYSLICSNEEAEYFKHDSYGTVFGIQDGYSVIVYGTSSSTSWGRKYSYVHGSNDYLIVYPQSETLVWSLAWDNISSTISYTPPISVSDGLVAYEIAPKDETFSTGYPEWSAGAVTVPAGTVGNASDITALPIGIGNDLQETLSASQQDVWAGVSTNTNTGTGDNTGDNTGTGSGSGSGTVTGTDLSAITRILNNIHSYQQSGTVGTQSKVDGLGEILGDTNSILSDSKGLLSSILAANAFGFETVQQSVIDLPGAIGNELTDIEDLLAGISGSLAGTKTGALSNLISWIQTIAQELAEVKEKVSTLPTDIAEAVSQAVTPSASAGAYAMELTDFFPFCLPYDLYEFLTILRATPEAPVFTWPINVPAIGLEYEIKIDLSPWDGVASLFRKLELLAFCVGLAYVSREKFLRA